MIMVVLLQSLLSYYIMMIVNMFTIIMATHALIIYINIFFSLAGRSQIWCGLWDDAARRTRRISPTFLWGPDKQEWGGVQQKLSHQYQSMTEQARDLPSVEFANKFDAWQDIPECKPGV